VTENQKREPFDKESVTDLAVREFLARGYDATSMTDLARAAGVTKSSFYYWVSGKEELLRLGIDRALGELFAVVDEDGAREGSPRARLEHILTRAIEVEFKLQAEVALLLRARGNSETETFAIARRREFTSLIADLIAEGVESGDFRDDVEPIEAARLILGMETSVIEWVGSHENLTAAGVARTVCALIFGGLEAR
jgi:AcrR family transcriptional regulator